MGAVAGVKRYPRLDANHNEIVAGLERLGVSVCSLAQLGGGVPDLLIGVRGQLFLLEIKNPKQKPSDRELTPDQKTWFAKWRGRPPVVVMSLADACAAIGLEVAL